MTGKVISIRQKSFFFWNKEWIIRLKSRLDDFCYFWICDLLQMKYVENNCWWYFTNIWNWPHWTLKDFKFRPTAFKFFPFFNQKYFLLQIIEYHFEFWNWPWQNSKLVGASNSEIKLGTPTSKVFTKKTYFDNSF